MSPPSPSGRRRAAHSAHARWDEDERHRHPPDGPHRSSKGGGHSETTSRPKNRRSAQHLHIHTQERM
eukprot:scaffold256609_cov27-Tisochrysis_lutea.AAC.1